ncbi:MAG: hypothetical protein IKO91_05705 [Oscillospiraceae bacterium]|nr:hypothetical protein [Oscillospiraceae bacterium]
MQLDLKKLAFGQYLSRHLLFEEADPLGRGWEKGLYLGLASESSSMFAGASARSAGFIRLKDASGGEFSAEAGPASVLLTSPQGEVKLAIDGPALLLKGTAGLSMVVRLGFGETVSRTKRGYELNMGPTRYIIAVQKGKADLEVGWDLVGLHSTDPVITLTPEDGVLEAVFWDSTTAYDLPEIAPDVDAAAKKAETAFQDFLGRLKGKNELFAYVLWLNFQTRKGAALLTANKIGDIRAVSMEQAIAALALKAPEAAELVSAVLGLMTPGGMVPAWVKGDTVLPESAPPLWGLPLCRAFAGGGIDAVPAEKLAALYALLDKAVGWWVKNRSLPEGAFFYAYPHESGFDGKPALPMGAPAVSPDLCLWMALNARALESMAVKLGLSKEAENWAALAQGQLECLASLWKDGGFVCRSAVDGAEAACPAGLGLLPLLLGDAAPDCAALEKAAGDAGKLDALLSALIALGSPALAEKALAAGAEKPDALSGGACSPVLCALGLALEERS